MKLTKSKLKQIIKEELQLVMGGMDHEENFIKALEEGFGEGTPPQGEFYKKQEIVAEDSLGTGIADAAAKEQEGISDRAIMEEDDDGFVDAAEEIEKKGTEGVFTAKAKKRGMTAQQFARKVLANTDEYDTKTVRQASFAKGAQTVANRKK